MFLISFLVGVSKETSQARERVPFSNATSTHPLPSNTGFSIVADSPCPRPLLDHGLNILMRQSARPGDAGSCFATGVSTTGAGETLVSIGGELAAAKLVSRAGAVEV